MQKIEKKGETQWFETLFYRKLFGDITYKKIHFRTIMTRKWIQELTHKCQKQLTSSVFIYKSESFELQLDASVVVVLMGLISHWRKLQLCSVRRPRE